MGTRYLRNPKNDFGTSYVISNINVIPMHRDTLLEDHFVWVKEGKIHEISQIRPKTKDTVISGEDRFLIPGLIDMHVHIWDEYELGLYLSHGITTVRNLWGMPMHLRFRDKVNNGELSGPLIYTSGPKLTGRTFIGSDNLNLQNASEATEIVTRSKEKGYDLVKTYYGLDRDIFDAVIQKSKELELEIAAHPSQRVPFEYHLQDPIRSIEHIEEVVQQPLDFDLSTKRLDSVLQFFSNNSKISYTPTLIVFYNILRMLEDDNYLQKEDVLFMNPLIRLVDSKSQFNRWKSSKERDSTTVDRIENQHRFQLEILKKMNEKAVRIISGSDAGIGVTVPGKSIHEEFNLYKESGMSNFEILQTATLNPSKTHTFLNDLGTIESGKRANFIITEKNPIETLETLKDPYIVIVGSKMYNQTVLKDFVKRSNNRNNYLTSLFRYLESSLDISLKP